MESSRNSTKRLKIYRLHVSALLLAAINAINNLKHAKLQPICSRERQKQFVMSPIFIDAARIKQSDKLPSIFEPNQ